MKFVITEISSGESTVIFATDVGSAIKIARDSLGIMGDIVVEEA